MARTVAGAFVGVAGGMAVGVFLGVLAGAADLVIGGIGKYPGVAIAGGVYIGVLAGATTGAIVGGSLGAFIPQRVPSQDRRSGGGRNPEANRLGLGAHGFPPRYLRARGVGVGVLVGTTASVLIGLALGFIPSLGGDKVSVLAGVLISAAPGALVGIGAGVHAGRTGTAM